MWGSKPLVWGSEPLVWGSKVNFANNRVWRSEMWGSWPVSPPTLATMIKSFLIQGDLINMRIKRCFQNIN